MWEGGGRRLNLALNQPLKAGDTVTLTLVQSSGIENSQLRVVTGDQLLSFDAGAVTLKGAEGQAFISLAIVEQGDIQTNADVTLRATVESKDAEGVSTFTESNRFSLKISDAGANTTSGPLEGTGEGEFLNLLTRDWRTVNGGAGNDEILGSDESDRIFAGAGDDVIAGNYGRDFIDAGSGNDFITTLREEATVFAGDGNDVIRAGWEWKATFSPAITSEIDADYIWQDLSAHLRTVTFEEYKNDPDLEQFGYLGLAYRDYSVDPGTGDVLLQGDSSLGNGMTYRFRITGQTDEAVYSLSGDPASESRKFFDLVSMPQDWPPDLEASVLLDGGAGDDFLEGKDGDDVLLGGSGHDLLWGLGGEDFLDGGENDDELHGGEDADSLFGGDGNDRLYGDAEGQVVMGDDYLNGEAGDDTLYGGDGKDTLLGGAGNDTLYGNAGEDILDGGGEDDLLVGAAGADILFGGKGNDQLAGDASNIPDDQHGDDYLDGGEGNDTLSGGSGDDLLVGGDGDDHLW